MIIHSIDQLIGQTPLFSFKYNTNEIYVKLEKYNPAGSIKDRAVLYMLKDALNKGIIKKDTVLIEATSGNTGIALAMLAQAYKIPLEIVMPASMSLERRQLIKAYGAKLILTDASKGMQGSMDYMNEKLQQHENYLSLQQFSNEANAYAHYDSTAQEILNDVTPDIFIAAIGTGGTITGIAKKLKEHNKDTIIYGIEPKSSPLLTQGHAGKHKIQGIGANFIPQILDTKLLDDVYTVSDELALETAINFAKEHGILIGLSSGANIAIALQIAQEVKNKKIVTIAPDGLEKYLSEIQDA
ncbi:MAG: cysteine synthase family protein [Erysipelotrichaceae bacterium]|nr:cysteine synthase family protein [Erysipelotrichaceae bacterium]